MGQRITFGAEQNHRIAVPVWSLIDVSNTHAGLVESGFLQSTDLGYQDPWEVMATPIAGECGFVKQVEPNVC